MILVKVIKFVPWEGSLRPLKTFVVRTLKSWHVVFETHVRLYFTLAQRYLFDILGIGRQELE